MYSRKIYQDIFLLTGLHYNYLAFVVSLHGIWLFSKRRNGYFCGIKGIDITSLTQSIFNAAIIGKVVGKNANC